ncbi:hypothetical protein ACWOEJ_07135 [Enterococcus eurekensis]|uniref:DUF624 domain-containing protein n=1 Tax=Enterococcus eurekensis TaxID=1159753 RepID=A0ABV9M725_9ENTE
MFSIESKFYRLTIYIYHLVLVNLLFLLTSILIISLPASFLALTKTMKEIENPGIIKTYFNYLKQDFIKVLPIGIFNLFSLMFGVSLQAISLQDSMFLKLVTLVFLFFLLSYNLNLYYIFGLSDEKINYFELFQQSFIWSLGIFYQNILLLIIFLGVFLFLFFQFPIVLSLCGISLPVLAYTKLFTYQLVKSKNI